MSLPENQPSTSRVCPNCGRVMQSDWNKCPSCGWVSGQLTSPTIPPPSQKQTISHNFAIVSIVFAILGFFIFGIIFGLVGIIFGSLAIGKRDKWGYAGLILGLIVFILTLLLL